MRFDFVPFGSGQRPSFREDLPWNPKLSYIVTYPGQAHLPGRHIAQTHLKSNRPGKLPNVPAMSLAISFEGVSAGNHAPEGFEVQHQPQLAQEPGEQKPKNLRFCSDPVGS
jgi:hypothetical protein